MSDIAIRCEGLSKQYRIGERERYRVLRDTLTDALYAPVRRLRSSLGNGNSRVGTRNSEFETRNSPTFWALKDLSFEIKRGEVVGVIGRNGAGKSTLLKILSRITAPTEGKVQIHGRVGSLLEVGTGFHPELTGRENIFLNGAILGMRKAEIERKFDEIVAFAEIEKFIDTPVKRYSSGMYVRLAFAVAAHMEPEIIVIDEVLAVGDAAFQKKCLGKLGSVAERGRTVLLVSHQMNQIRRLCTRCVWLDKGKLKMSGSAVEVISPYEMNSLTPLQDLSVSVDDNTTRFLMWEVLEPRQSQSNTIMTIEPVVISFKVQIGRTIRHGHHTIALCNKDGLIVWGTEIQNFNIARGVHDLVYKLPAMPLAPGNYIWRVGLFDGKGVVDSWDGNPELVIGTEPLTNSKGDGTAGILNVGCEFLINTPATPSIVG